MCSQITDLAFGAKCGAFGASGSSTAANAGALDSTPPASDSAPTPYPVLSRKSRRVVTLLMSNPHLLKPVTELVGIGHRMHQIDEGCGARRIELLLLLLHLLTVSERCCIGLRGTRTRRHTGDVVIHGPCLGEFLLALVEVLYEGNALATVRRAAIESLVDLVYLGTHLDRHPIALGRGHLLALRQLLTSGLFLLVQERLQCLLLE